MKLRLIFLAPLFLSACQQTYYQETLNGPIQNERGNPIGSMHVLLTTGGTPDTVALATSSNGETFRGSLIVPTTQSETNTDTSSVIDTGKKSKKHPDGLKTVNSSTISTTTNYFPQAHAVLIGNHGHSMNCLFTLSNPQLGLILGGGIGQCNLSAYEFVPLIANRQYSTIIVQHGDPLPPSLQTVYYGQ